MYASGCIIQLLQLESDVKLTLYMHANDVLVCGVELRHLLADSSLPDLVKDCCSHLHRQWVPTSSVECGSQCALYDVL